MIVNREGTDTADPGSTVAKLLSTITLKAEHMPTELIVLEELDSSVQGDYRSKRTRTGWKNRIHGCMRCDQKIQ